MPVYQIDEKELHNIINNAPQHILRIARKKEKPAQKSFDELKDQWKHRRLSQAWVKYLGQSLEKSYQKKYNNKNIYAFPSQFDLKKKLGIKQSEFLFDVSVGLYNSFKSTKNEGLQKLSPIHYQAHSIWQIESEFAENTREIAIDFSKLFAGNADYAMMVGPRGKEKTNYYMDEMKKMLMSIDTLNGKILYFLILPHPRDWTDNDHRWRSGNIWYLYKWNGKDWGNIIAKDKWEIESGNRSSL